MTFNDIFDVMNSSKLRDANKRKSAIACTSDNVAFLKSMSDWIATIRAVDNTTNKDVNNLIKCFNGCLISIAAVCDLWIDLHDNHAFDFLCTRRLNQDPLENLFFYY